MTTARPRTLALTLTLTLALSAVARADVSAGRAPPDPNATANAPLLRLDFDVRPVAGEPSLVEAHARALRLLAPDGRTLWHRAPPAQVRTFLADRALAAAYLANPRASLDTIAYPIYAVRARPDAILLAIHDALLVLDRRDGHTLLDAPVGELGFGSLTFQHAEVTVTCGGRRAVERVRGGGFLVDAGACLVYHSGPGFSVFTTAPWAAAGSNMFPDVVQPDSANTYVFDVGGAHIVVRVLN